MAVSRVEHASAPAVREAAPDGPTAAEPAAFAQLPPVPGLAFPIQRKVAVGSATDPAEVEAELRGVPGPPARRPRARRPG